MARSDEIREEIRRRLGKLPRGGLSPLQGSVDPYFGDREFEQLIKSIRNTPVSPDQGAARTAQLEAADSNSGFNFFDMLFRGLDVFGRPVRDAAGIFTALGSAAFSDDPLAQLGKAGDRFIDVAVAPLASVTDFFTLQQTDLRDALNFFSDEKHGTSGSSLLDDLGWKTGTTMEEERRIRLAMAGGLGRNAAERKFRGAKLDEDRAAELDKLVQKAVNKNPNLDLGITAEDLGNATDAQDFGGLAVEILLDPTTYLTGGLSAAGKAAKGLGLLQKVAPRLVGAVRANADDAAKVAKLFKASIEATEDVGKTFKAEIDGTEYVLESISKRQGEKLLHNIESAYERSGAGQAPSFWIHDTLEASAKAGKDAPASASLRKLIATMNEADDPEAKALAAALVAAGRDAAPAVLESFAQHRGVSPDVLMQSLDLADLSGLPSTGKLAGLGPTWAEQSRMGQRDLLRWFGQPVFAKDNPVLNLLSGIGRTRVEKAAQRASIEAQSAAARGIEEHAIAEIDRMSKEQLDVVDFNAVAKLAESQGGSGVVELAADGRLPTVGDEMRRGVNDLGKVILDADAQIKNLQQTGEAVVEADKGVWNHVKSKLSGLSGFIQEKFRVTTGVQGIDQTVEQAEHIREGYVGFARQLSTLRKKAADLVKDRTDDAVEAGAKGRKAAVQDEQRRLLNREINLALFHMADTVEAKLLLKEVGDAEETLAAVKAAGADPTSLKPLEDAVVMAKARLNVKLQDLPAFIEKNFVSETELGGGSFHEIVSGIYQIQNEILNKKAIREMTLPLNTLSPDNVGYVHHSMTRQAHKWLRDRNNQRLLEKELGLKWDTDKQMLVVTDKTKLKNLLDINSMFRMGPEKLAQIKQATAEGNHALIRRLNPFGVDAKSQFAFFNPDPIVSTRLLVKEAHRHMANARMVQGLMDFAVDAHGAVAGLKQADPLIAAKAVQTLKEQGYRSARELYELADLKIGIEGFDESTLREFEPLAKAGRQAVDEAKQAIDGRVAEAAEQDRLRKLADALSPEARKEIESVIKLQDAAAEARRVVNDAINNRITDADAAARLKKLNSGIPVTNSTAEIMSRVSKRASDEALPGPTGEATKFDVADLAQAAESDIARYSAAVVEDGDVALLRALDQFKPVELAATDLEKAVLKLKDAPDFDKVLDAAVGVHGLDNKMIAPELFKVVENALLLQKEPALWLNYMDSILKWMKSTVTVPFLAFHGRNMLENLTKFMIEAIDLRNPARSLGDIRKSYADAIRFMGQANDLNAGSPDWVGQAGRKLKSAFRKMSGKPKQESIDLLRDAFGLEGTDQKVMEQAWDRLFAMGVFENQLTAEFGEVLLKGAPEEAFDNKTARLEQAAKQIFRQFTREGAPIRAGFALAGVGENLHRVAYFFHKLKEGALPEEAAQEVKRVFFDYRKMTNFESNVMKRLGFFYNFYRHNLRYIIQTAYEKPQLTKQIVGLFRDDPDDPRFSWLSEKGAFHAGAYDVALGFLPQQQFGMFSLAEGDILDKVSGKLGDMGAMGNPIAANMAEAMFDEDLYTHQPLHSPGKAGEWSAAPPFIKDIIGHEVREDGTYQIDGTWNFILGTVPALGRFNQLTNLLSDPEQEYWQKLSQSTTGVRFVAQDRTDQAYQKISRDIEREGRALPHMVREGTTYRADRRTAEGRLISALGAPTTEKLKDLAAISPEIFIILQPYMTWDDAGEPHMNKVLDDKIHQIFVQRYPRHAAYYDALKIQVAVKEQLRSEKRNVYGELAAERFPDIFTNEEEKQPLLEGAVLDLFVP